MRIKPTVIAPIVQEAVDRKLVDGSTIRLSSNNILYFQTTPDYHTLSLDISDTGSIRLVVTTTGEIIESLEVDMVSYQFIDDDELAEATSLIVDAMQDFVATDHLF